jgi:opacity protein-like surface antigen
MERYCHKLLTASRFACGVFTGMLLAMGAPGCCQSAPQTTQHFEVSGSYAYVRANSSSTGESFNLQGGSVSAAYRLGHGVSIAGDVGGYYFTDLPDGVSGRMYTYVAGPRFYFRRQARISPFGEILVGAARHTAETATDQAGENSFALLLGGGLDLNLTHNFAIRAVQADYLMTRFAGTTGDSAIQNNVRFSAGIVFRF